MAVKEVEGEVVVGYLLRAMSRSETNNTGKCQSAIGQPVTCDLPTSHSVRYLDIGKVIRYLCLKLSYDT